MEYKLYSLNEPITNEIRYIGYTSKTLKERLSSHWNGRNHKKKSHKLNWFNHLDKKGLKPCIKLITSSDNIEDILELEKYYISLYENLTNSTSGGEISKTYLPEVVAKMKANRKYIKGIENPIYGIKRPDLAERNKVFVWTEESKNKIRQKQLKHNECPLFKENHTIVQKTRIELEVYKDDKLIGKYPSKRKCSEILKLDRKSINCVLNGEYKQHKGYTFKEVAI